jgi:hypothetical protein
MQDVNSAAALLLRLKIGLSLLFLLMQKLPSSPNDYADNKPVENRVENGPRCNYRNANESRSGYWFSPALMPVHGEPTVLKR